MADIFSRKAQFSKGFEVPEVGIFSSVSDVTFTVAAAFSAVSAVSLATDSDAAAVRTALARTIQVLEALRKGENLT